MGQSAPLPTPMLSAALRYAREGLRIFPCNSRNKQPLLAADKDPLTGKPIRGTGGLHKATTNELQITEWWRKWPDALIGLPTGQAVGGTGAVFVLDFDPRTDAATGEVFTLERLKADLEAQMGCALPPSRAALTQSDGVHVYLRTPDDGGEAIRNRGNLPLHVDVRGEGGYVIAPPSVMHNGNRYRWLRGLHDAPIAEAPAALIAILRARQAGATKDVAAASAAAAASSSPSTALPADPSASPGDDAGSDNPSALPRRERPNGRRAIDEDEAVEEAVRRYAYAALDGEVRKAAAAGDGTRNTTISIVALTLGHLVGAGALSRSAVIAALSDVARQWPDFEKTMASVESGVDKGATEPRDLTRVRDEARERHRRWRRPDPRAARDDDEPEPFQMEGSGDDEAGGPGGGDVELHARLARFPLTDLGNAERFRERFGGDFRWSNALGWLGWDGRRWAVLEQDEKSVPAKVLGRVFDMVRAIQQEAAVVRASGVPFPPEVDFDELSKDEKLEWLRQKHWAEQTPELEGERLDFIAKVSAKGVVTLYSDLLAAHGRASEASGKLGCIANLVRPWLAVAADAFDADPFAINVLNGTLRFRRIWLPETKQWKPEWRIDPHDREDLISKLAPVEFDRAAECPVYDDMLAWAQPDAGMRRYLHQWGGLSLTGEMGEQALHFWYGLGGNGKSTAMDVWCKAAGDYSTTIGIETFLDQGVKKRGDQATPDLARLGGVRLLRTSEPEKGGKLASALIKLVTGGEPMTVRFLNRGFFDLRPIFKLTIQGNFRPDIPDTDDGIWRRVKLIPWEQRVRDEMHPEGTREKDPELPDKLLPELSGIFNRLVQGLLDWLENGLVEPGKVTEATKAYRTASDPLGRFLRLCTRHDPAKRTQSSKLHAVFVAWCRAAGEKEWTNKGFSKALEDKGYTKKASDGMQWLGIELIREASDFIDNDGNPLPFTLPDDEAARLDPPPLSHSPADDDDDAPL